MKRVTRALGGVREIWGLAAKVYRRASDWNKFALVSSTLTCALLVIVFVLTQKSTEQSGSFLFGAIGAIMLWSLTQFASESAKIEEKRQNTIELTLALYAEILSNLKQQRAVMTKENIGRKIEKELKNYKIDSTQETNTNSTFGLADNTNVFFDKAKNTYGFIPPICVVDVVEYYNLNDMFNRAYTSILGDQLSRMTELQRAETLNAVFVLGNRLEEAAENAIRRLRGHLAGNEGAVDQSVLLAKITNGYVYRSEDFPLLSRVLSQTGNSLSHQGQDRATPTHDRNSPA